MDDQREPMDTDMVMVPRKLLLEVCETAQEDSEGYERNVGFSAASLTTVRKERERIAELRAYAEGER